MQARNLFDRLEPRSIGQGEMRRALLDKSYDIVGLFGPTGTGKSLFSVLYSISAVMGGEYKRFIIARPVVDVVTGKELTAADLGELYYELASSYLRDILEGFVEWSEVEELIRGGKIVFADTHYLRGRTFDDSIIFLDDAQSIKPESAVEVLMRIGSNSRFIIAGDPVFQKKIGELDGATMIREVLLGEETARVVDLGLKDIVRPGARRGIKLLIELRMRSRPMSEAEKNIMEIARIHAPDADIVTVVEFSAEKKLFDINPEAVPDALIVVKEGSLARLIGRGGERINGIENDTGLRIRGVELSLDLRPLIRAIHPVSWINKYIVDVDLAGPSLLVKVDTNGYGAFVGQRGSHVRFIDTVMRKLMDIGVKALEVEQKKRRKR